MAAKDELKEKAKKLRELARKAEKASGGGYDRHKEQAAERQREQAAAGREIGPIPPVADVERRNACLDNLSLFCRTYFPNRFSMPFAGIHEAAMSRMARCSDEGGLFACAMPRGSGKTTLAECAVLRSLLYGLRSFVLLVAATEKHASRALKRMQAELETNDLLLADFPEVCYPVRQLERIAQRAKGQTLGGEPTRMEWTAESLVMPHVRGAASSGGVVQVAGLTGAIRGLNLLGPNGQPMRPDMVVIDDAQTRESARSPTQTIDREAIICDDVLGLAGPTTTIAAVMLCTVIYPDDLSDRFLNPEKHPEWQGIRTKMLDAFPADLTLWDRYSEVRRESFRSGDEGRRATEFYQDNRAAMDAGAVVTWPERHKKGELSGIQSAMNLYIDNPRGFKAEYQNEPDRGDLGAGAKELIPAVVAARLSGVERFTVPRECSRITTMIDCHKNLLYYTTIAWGDNFGGSVIDYGTWPRQNRTNFTLADARPAMTDKYPGLNEEQLLFRGLMDLTAEILPRPYYREGGGAELKIERCLIDAGWQSPSVYQFIRSSPHSGIIYPSKGIGRTTTSRGVSEWKPRPGERSGFHWRLTAGEKSAPRTVQFDPDAWKSLLFERLTTPPGGSGHLSFFGQSAGVHEMIADHCGAEYSESQTIRGTTFDKWEVRPHKPDNHFFDTMTGAAVAAGVAGLTTSAAPVDSRPPEKPRPVKLSDVYKRKQMAAGRA